MTGTLTSSVRTSQKESVQGLEMIAESFTIIRCWGCRESGRSESRMTRVRSILSSRQQSVSVMENTVSRMKIQSGLARDSESIDLNPLSTRYKSTFLRRFTSADAWRYQSPKELGHIDYWGISSTYSGGGSVQDLDLEKGNTEAIIRVKKTLK